MSLQDTKIAIIGLSVSYLLRHSILIVTLLVTGGAGFIGANFVGNRPLEPKG